MFSGKRWGLAALLCAGLVVAGCGRPQPAFAPGQPGSAIDLPSGEPNPGTAVVVLIDTSGSMRDPVPDHDGKKRPKYELAREALETIVGRTTEWKKSHPDRHLQMGLIRFSASTTEVLPMGEFEGSKAEAAVKRIPRPDGGTAIGLALIDGFKALYRTGCERKFVLCITDGENTNGPPPDQVARQLHAQTGGKVEIHFIAFDTNASIFGFLKDVNGQVVEAANAKQLLEELSKVYEKRIFAESTEPFVP
jgi:hypothetical protein